jgi:hypothetical protein
MPVLASSIEPRNQLRQGYAPERAYAVRCGLFDDPLPRPYQDAAPTHCRSFVAAVGLLDSQARTVDQQYLTARCSSPRSIRRCRNARPGRRVTTPPTCIVSETTRESCTSAERSDRNILCKKSLRPPVFDRGVGPVFISGWVPSTHFGLGPIRRI